MGISSPGRERRVVSVLFCDLVGSTTAAEDADPEDAHAILSGFHQAVRDRIRAFGGVVEKYVGDAVMAIFGVPTAHEDDAERAVRAALALAEDAQAGRLPTIRVGVNTGEVLAVLDASPERGESTVIGDVVNAAARLQGAAPRNGVVVGELTHRATDRVFEYAELAPALFKGKKDPVALWQPLAAKSRFGADVLRDLSTPMVGRDAELGLLLDAFDRAAAGRGAELVTVLGEPGVGKSRLVAELLAHLDRRGELLTWRLGRCPPYGAEVPYSALADIVKAQLGVYDNDSVDIVRAKLDAAVSGEDAAWLHAMLAPLVGLSGPGQVDRGQQFAAWTRYVTSWTANRPAILVVEDLHWADPRPDRLPAPPGGRRPPGSPGGPGHRPARTTRPQAGLGDRPPASRHNDRDRTAGPHRHRTADPHQPRRPRPRPATSAALVERSAATPSTPRSSPASSVMRSDCTTSSVARSRRPTRCRGWPGASTRSATAAPHPFAIRRRSAPPHPDVEGEVGPFAEGGNDLFTNPTLGSVGAS